MHIVVGRGNNRHVFDIPSKKDKIGREKVAEDLKNYLFRPAMLNRSN